MRAMIFRAPGKQANLEIRRPTGAKTFMARPPRAALAARRRCCAPSPCAFLALDAFLAPPPMLLQPPHEVVMVFTTVTPLSLAPQCLCALTLEDLLQPAPPLRGPNTAQQLQRSLSNSYASIGVHPALRRVLAAQDSFDIDTAVCLVSPVILEEDAAEIIHESVDEMQHGHQMQLRHRYASELHLYRQDSLQDGSKGKSKDKRWGSSNSSNSDQLRLALQSPEVRHAVQELLQSQDDNKNTLQMDALHTFPPHGGASMDNICLASMEEPDHLLLASCLASIMDA